MDLYSLARPLLFTLDPEIAHRFTLFTLDRLAALNLLPSQPALAQPRQLLGLTFPNAVGLAAGLDKDGAHIDGLASLGFGFIEVGTVTPRPQAGNPPPRLFRLPQAHALINRMGFNNQGVDAFLANIQKARYRGILGLNIGKNADTPIERAADDYLFCLRAVYPHASYVTINISSPNTKNLRQLQSGDDLTQLLDQLKTAQGSLHQQHGRYVPLLLKIAPDLEDEQIEWIAQRLLECGMDGVIATNTTLARSAVQGLSHADETGGLSGAPVCDLSTAVIAQLHALLKNRLPIIGVGGILSGDDAVTKIAAGASLIQLYSGLIYRGPALVRECVRAIG
ncbi:MAG: quinone-dependent dihydroorotate dehydrogenase [Burkholderiaceae bacterium]|nr:MAG: quinone-dependent dihydroorotate dehydrogenase [Burkholderiaceae bacterium]